MMQKFLQIMWATFFLLSIFMSKIKQSIIKAYEGTIEIAVKLRGTSI